MSVCEGGVSDFLRNGRAANSALHSSGEEVGRRKEAPYTLLLTRNGRAANSASEEVGRR